MASGGGATYYIVIDDVSYRVSGWQTWEITTTSTYGEPYSLFTCTNGYVYTLDGTRQLYYTSTGEPVSSSDMAKLSTQDTYYTVPLADPHKTLIDGTAFQIKGGKCLVDGTAYDVTGGKTLVEGTAYAIMV